MKQLLQSDSISKIPPSYLLSDMYHKVAPVTRHSKFFLRNRSYFLRCSSILCALGSTYMVAKLEWDEWNPNWQTLCGKYWKKNSYLLQNCIDLLTVIYCWCLVKILSSFFPLAKHSPGHTTRFIAFCWIWINLEWGTQHKQVAKHVIYTSLCIVKECTHKYHCRAHKNVWSNKPEAKQ